MRAAPPHGPDDAVAVVVAYDFSPTADEALHRAIEDAARNPAHVLHVITVIDARHGTPIAPTDHVDHDYVERIKRVVSERVTDMLAGQPGSRDRAFEVHAPIGPAANEILGLAHKLRAASVYVGSHGKTNAERILLGSVSERVLHDARCTVVVVRRSPRR